jgi:lysophospholipase L1-like esterase
MTETWDWLRAMKKVRRAFHGPPGVFIQLGDSLTLAYPNALWALAGKGHTAEEAAFLEWAHAGTKDQRDGWHLATAETACDAWSVTTFTATVGCSSKYILTGRRGLPPLKEMLATYNPQMAVYAIGLSDILRDIPLLKYMANVAKAMKQLRANGTVPILSTLTPSGKHNDKVLRTNDSLREFAQAEKLPLLDIYAEMEKRNKNVFEFLDPDGIHLTCCPLEGPPTEENFLTSGYLLRCYLTVRKGMEVKQHVLDVPDGPGLREKTRQFISQWWQQSSVSGQGVSGS